MANINDFQKIAEQYANKIAKERGTKVRWVCLDGSQKHIREQYPDRKLSYDVKDPVFHWGKPSPKQDTMFRQTLTNNGSERPKTTIKRSEKKSDTFSWSITEGIKVGQSVTAKAGVNIEAISAGVEETTSFEFNLSSTQGQSKTVERTWEVDQEITQAPHANTEISWLLDRNKADGTFNADIIISGSVAIWFENKIDLNHAGGDNLHWLWFPSPSTIVRTIRPAGFRTSGSRVIFNATGRIKADVGLESRLIINQEPIGAKSGAKTAAKAAPAAVKAAPKTEYLFDASGNRLESTIEAGAKAAAE
jgi:hypothetical protein